MPRAPSSLAVFAVMEGGARRVAARGDADGAMPATVHAALAGPGPAVYTALRSHGRRGFLALTAHLDRLSDSCRRCGLPAPDAARLRRALRAVVPASDDRGCMVRIEVRATPPPRLDTGSTVLLGLWPARADDPGRRIDGVSAATAPGARRVLPAAKDSAWMTDRQQWLRDPAAAEHILLDSRGRMLEGFTSNLLAVADGVVHAPTTGVLPGVTMALVLRLCGDLGLPVVRRPWAGPATALDELAITSSGRGIWPVTRLDGRPVGAGGPGPVTRRLVGAWDAAWAGWLEPA